MKQSPRALQWNCRSFFQAGPILAARVAQILPFLIFLQETRSSPSLRGYITSTEPSITHVNKAPIVSVTGS